MLAVALWRQARPAPHVGESTVFTHGSPSLPGPAFRHANAVADCGQHVCAEGHSQGFWLQGVVDPLDPLLLLEQAARVTKSTAWKGMRMAAQY